MQTRLGALCASTTLALILTLPSVGLAQGKPAPLTEKQVLALLQTAATPAQHEQLAAHYDEDAVDFAAKAAKHERLAAAYRSRPQSGSPRASRAPNPARHCEKIASEAKLAAEEAKAMADYHRMMARDLEKR